MLICLVDSDADIVDPLAPQTLTKESTDLLGDFEDIVAPVDLLHSTVNVVSANPVEDTTNGPNVDAFDLKDFDPLSQEEIEEGIKTEKMISAELLKRSRDVVSNRAVSGKSWLERTLSQTLSSGSASEVRCSSANLKSKSKVNVLYSMTALKKYMMHNLLNVSYQIILTFKV